MKYVPLDFNRTYNLRKAGIALASIPGFPVVGVLVIDERKTPEGKPTVSRYAAVELVWDKGRRFRLTKTTGEQHHTLLAPAGVGFDRCDCTGFEQFGRCKHTEAMRALERAGELPWVRDYSPEAHDG